MLQVRANFIYLKGNLGIFQLKPDYFIFVFGLMGSKFSRYTSNLKNYINYSYTMQQHRASGHKKLIEKLVNYHLCDNRIITTVLF